MTDSVTAPAPSRHLEAGLRVIGGKWKVLIVWHLSVSSQRYGGLRRLIPGVTEKMLIRQLRELEADAIVTRTDHHIVPPHVDYSLSEYGRSLLPVLDALCHWGRLHITRES